MATIVLKYNERNTKAQNMLNYVLSTGLLTRSVEKENEQECEQLKNVVFNGSKGLCRNI